MILKNLSCDSYKFILIKYTPGSAPVPKDSGKEALHPEGSLKSVLRTTDCTLRLYLCPTAGFL